MKDKAVQETLYGSYDLTMKAKYYILFSFLLGFMSCNIGPSMQFEVENDSNNIITKINISTTGKKNNDIIELENNKNINYNLDMAHIPKVDGAYQIEFFRDGEIVIEQFGYYTNGYPINMKYNIKITDTQLSITEI